MRTKNLKLCSLLMVPLLFLCLSSTEALAQPALNVGVFDMQKVLGDSDKGKKAKSGLEDRFKKMQADLKKKEDDINKLSTDLRKLASAASPDMADLRKRDENIKKKVADYQEQLGKSNEEMRKAEETVLKPLVDLAVKTAGDLAKQRGYIVILETQQAGVVYSVDAIDLTSEIISAVDK